MWEAISTTDMHLFQLFLPGTADGNILVFLVPSKGPSVKLQETLDTHQGSICDIVSDGNIMASSDETGKILIWKSGGQFVKTAEIDGFG